jgi:hypothetical protein
LQATCSNAVPTEPLSKASPCANNKIEQFSDGVDE